jgi:LysR family transcriptional regulator for metE and metH
VPTLEIRHLAMLVALSETGSVTQAAQRLGITQSAVTHRIGEAQRRLGVNLVKRVGRRVFLTPAAERLHAVALRTLGDIERVEQEVIAQHSRSVNLVRFGQAVYSRYRWLPGFLKAFERALRDIELDLVARATYQPLQTLQEGAVDIVSVSGPKGPEGSFEWIHLMRDPLVVIMSRDHRLAHRGRIDPSDLSDERFIAHANAREPGFEWQAKTLPIDLPLRHAKEVQLPEAIIDLVGAGLGVSVLPYWIVMPEVASGALIARPLTKQGVWIDWWAVIRSSEREGSPTRRVAQALVKWCDRPEAATVERLDGPRRRHVRPPMSHK